MNIGENIKKYRKALNISQKDLAKKLNMPISTLANYENNHREPNIETLNKIAVVLGVTINDLVGSKKTLTQQLIEEALKALTIDELSKEINVPVKEIESMLNNKIVSMGSWKKLLKYCGATPEQEAEIFTNDMCINAIYNNDGSDKTLNKLKKMIFNETLTLDEVLENVPDEDKEFISHLYYAGALNTNGVIKDGIKISKKSPDFKDSNIMKPINTLTQFLKENGYPVDKLNNKILGYLYEKISDLLEFEFYKLEQNNFEIPNKKDKK